MEQDLINKIEFVDLPGYDRKINVFNENQYYNNILKFSNSCIYINTAETISGDENFKRMSAQYNGDKNNIFSTLQPKFIDTCLFLINKSDQLTKEKDKQQAENNLKNNISKIEPLVENNKNRINVSFFSGLYFFQYLKDYQLFVSNMENNPLITLKKLFKQWSSNKFYFFNFKKYIIDKVTGKIEDSYDDIDDKKAPKWFYDNLKKAFNQLYYKKYRGISEKEED